MKRNFIFKLFVLLTVSLSSCKDFLIVDPKSSLSENQMFESEVGFQQALTGVYSQLASRNLYGDNLSMGFVSALAQNYAAASSGSPFYRTKQFNYDYAEVRSYLNQIWNNAYSSIAGANKIIANADLKKSMLSPQSYALLKGESLAIRALLHFDLLRLFGKSFAENPNAKAIPYKKTVDEFAVVPSTTAEIITLVLEDLKAAEDLLKPYDGVLDDISPRRHKLNYWAVKGLEARVNMYAGNKNEAYQAAQEVVNSGKFVFVAAEDAGASEAFRDRLYLSELLFCIRPTNLDTWVENIYFRYRSGTTTNLLRSEAQFKVLFETSNGGGASDYRYAYGINNNGSNSVTTKYWQTYYFKDLTDYKLDRLVPIIRLSELYYIMAECTENPTLALQYLNQIRSARALTPLFSQNSDANYIQSELQKEYQKEFYAEGQTFWYYKRKQVKRMQFMTSDFDTKKYVLPIPNDELEFNPNYN